MPPEARGYVPSSEIGRHREDAPPPMSARPGEEAQVAGKPIGQTERQKRREKTEEQLARIKEELGLSDTGIKTKKPIEAAPIPTKNVERPAPLPKPDLSKKAKKGGLFERVKDLFGPN